VSRSIRYRSGAPGIEALSISSTVELTVLLSGTTKKMLSSFELLIQYQPNRRCMRKKNKYKLDKEAHLKSKTLIAEVALRYDMDSDEMTSTVMVRKDVDDDDLLLRIGRQFENALRTVLPPYKQEMDQLDRLAKMGADIGLVDLDEDFFNAEEYFDAKDS
jgi:hypothetical protein